MSDENKALKILIELGVIGKADAIAAKQLLQETSTVATGTAGAQQKMAESSQEAAKGAKLLGKESKEIKKLMGELMTISPGLGLLLKGAFSPVGATVGAAMLVLNHFRKEIDELNKSLDEMGKAAARPIGDMKASFFEARREIAEFNYDLEKWFKTLEDVSKKKNDELDITLAKIHEQTAALGELITAQEKAGMLPPGTADEQKKTAAKKGDAAEIAAKEKRLAEINAELETEAAKEVQYIRHHRDLKAQAAEINRGKSEKDIEEQLVAAQSRLNSPETVKLRDTADAQALKYKKEKDFLEAIGADPEKQMSFSAVKRAQRGMEEARAEVYQREQMVKALEKSLKDIQEQNIKLRDITRLEEDQKGHVLKLKNERDGLLKAVTLERIKAEEAAKGEAAEKQWKNVSQSPLGGAAIGDVNAAIATADKYVNRQYKDITSKDAAQMISVASEIAGKPVNLGGAITMMELAKKNHDIFTNDVTRLVGVMRTMLDGQVSITQDTDYLTTEVGKLREQMRQLGYIIK